MVVVQVQAAIDEAADTPDHEKQKNSAYCEVVALPGPEIRGRHKAEDRGNGERASMPDPTVLFETVDPKDGRRQGQKIDKSDNESAHTVISLRGAPDATHQRLAWRVPAYSLTPNPRKCARNLAL